MARTWLSIEVELVSGQGRAFWPRPGRTIAAAPSHTFWHVARTINLGFGRWDLSHLSLFILDDGTRISPADPWFDPPDGTIEIEKEKLSRLTFGEQFAYTFDFGDDWTHLCTVARQKIDPESVSVRSPMCPPPTSAGVTHPTNSDVGGPPTTERAGCFRTLGAPTSLPCCRSGAGCGRFRSEHHR